MQGRRTLLYMVAVTVLTIVCCLYLNRRKLTELRDLKLPTTYGPTRNDSFDVPAVVLPRPLNDGRRYGVELNYSNTTVESLSMRIQPVHTSPSQQTSESTSLGYLLAANVEQQITHAVVGYTELASLASLLNLTSVEPYICNTYLSTLPTVGSNGIPCAMNLSTFYNMRSFRAMLDSCSPTNTHEMVTFQRFLEQASSELVLVYVLHTFDKYKSKSKTGKLVELHKSDIAATPKELTKLNRWASYVSKQKRIQSPKFRLSRVFLMDARPTKALHLQTVLSILGSVINQQHSKSGSATILFHNWRGIHNITNSKFFYYIPEYYKLCFPVYSLEDSQQVFETAKVFAQSIEDKELETRTRIGIHIRGEKLLRIKKDKFVHCFDELDALLHEMSSNTSGQMTVWMIHDLRKYGTVTCTYGDCKRLRPKFLSELKKRGYNVTFFDPVKFPSIPQSPAFASFVERAYLSQMDVLITLGTGAYQDTVVASFLQQKQHTKQHLHRICGYY